MMKILLLYILVAMIPVPTRYTLMENDFVRIPSGTYSIGEGKHPLNPSCEVTTGEFYISRTEITNSQFAEFIRQTNYLTDAERYKNALIFYPGLDEFEWAEDTTAYWRFPFGKAQGGIEAKMNHPVTCISYMDVMAYCAWAKVRLPTLAEWEIACRAGTKTRFFWGEDSKSISKYGNVWHGKTHKALDSLEDIPYTAPVASYLPNPWGLYDMYGNVFEFCSDKPTPLLRYTDNACARGGSWWCSEMSCGYFNSVDIGSVNKHASFSNHGFRVVQK